MRGTKKLWSFSAHLPMSKQCTPRAPCRNTASPDFHALRPCVLRRDKPSSRARVDITETPPTALFFFVELPAQLPCARGLARGMPVACALVVQEASAHAVVTSSTVRDRCTPSLHTIVPSILVAARVFLATRPNFGGHDFEQSVSRFSILNESLA